MVLLIYFWMIRCVLINNEDWFCVWINSMCYFASEKSTSLCKFKPKTGTIRLFEMQFQRLYSRYTYKKQSIFHLYNNIFSKTINNIFPFSAWLQCARECMCVFILRLALCRDRSIRAINLDEDRCRKEPLNIIHGKRHVCRSKC